MWSQQAGVFGHPVNQLDCPDIILLGGLLWLRRRNIHPALSPLSHWETWFFQSQQLPIRPKEHEHAQQGFANLQSRRAQHNRCDWRVSSA